MPSAVIRGDPLWLNCSFDLESDDLYSVKWYKNHREFFRFLPSENPPGQAYRLSGVYADASSGHADLVSSMPAVLPVLTPSAVVGRCNWHEDLATERVPGTKRTTASRQGTRCCEVPTARAGDWPVTGTAVACGVLPACYSSTARTRPDQATSRGAGLSRGAATTTRNPTERTGE
ncbi:hypothetical protein HPB50_018020 [Hyalomma asiaticum]|uniref:Uncharacterized protein n=1 Tax=Hyalomma asiaticum TaxID=266040 RepID=A0ACB7S884_HYAAI|nr:hypothetical protein HPB50_018020 [Hyalomma asiaticum]